MKERCAFMDAYIGEIRLLSFGFAPRNWLPCQGQLCPIGKFPDLFKVIGAYYGGDGTTNFKLPDLRGSTPVNFGGPGKLPKLGEAGGNETTTLAADQIPSHSHFLLASPLSATVQTPVGNLLASPVAPNNLYTSTLKSEEIVPFGKVASGGNQPFKRRQPYQTI
jgi:microcystin-dependent protein